MCPRECWWRSTVFLRTSVLSWASWAFHSLQGSSPPPSGWHSRSSSVTQSSHKLHLFWRDFSLHWNDLSLFSSQKSCSSQILCRSTTELFAYLEISPPRPLVVPWGKELNNLSLHSQSLSHTAETKVYSKRFKKVFFPFSKASSVSLSWAELMGTKKREVPLVAAVRGSGFGAWVCVLLRHPFLELSTAREPRGGHGCPAPNVSWLQSPHQSVVFWDVLPCHPGKLTSRVFSRILGLAKPCCRCSSGMAQEGCSLKALLCSTPLAHLQFQNRGSIMSLPRMQAVSAISHSPVTFPFNLQLSSLQLLTFS